VVKSYMTENYDKGWKYQLSTPTYDYGIILLDLNVGEFYLFVISSLSVYGIT